MPHSEYWITTATNTSWVKDYLPILISSLALLLTLITIWKTNLKPFKLILSHSGRVIFGANPEADHYQPTLELKFIFFNLGAKAGLIGDLAALMVCPDENKILMRTLYEPQDKKRELNERLTQPDWLPFNSFAIEARASVTKNIYFVPTKPELNYQFALGRYKIVVYSMTSNNWTEQLNVEFEITQSDLAVVLPRTIRAMGTPDRYVEFRTQNKPSLASENALESLTTSNLHLSA